MDKRIVIGIGVGVIAAAIAVIIFALDRAQVPIQQPGQHPVVVSVLPKYAQIKISGSEDYLVNNQVNYLDEGEYTVSITADNFAPEEMSFTVKQDLRPKVITALSAIGDAEITYSEEDMLELERASGAASQEYTEIYERKYPAKKLLPYRDPYYRIGYSSTDGTDFYITVHTESPRYRELALQKIISMGISPTKYKIVFRDYEFPLQEAQ